MNGDYERLAEELKALANPLRIAVLVTIAKGIEAPAEIHRALHTPADSMSLTLVSYHIEKLHQGGLVEQSHEERAGNFLRHFYRPTERGAALLKALGVAP